MPQPKSRTGGTCSQQWTEGHRVYWPWSPLVLSTLLLSSQTIDSDLISSGGGFFRRTALSHEWYLISRDKAFTHNGTVQTSVVDPDPEGTGSETFWQDPDTDPEKSHSGAGQLRIRNEFEVKLLRKTEKTYLDIDLQAKLNPDPIRIRNTGQQEYQRPNILL